MDYNNPTAEDVEMMFADSLVAARPLPIKAINDAVDASIVHKYHNVFAHLNLEMDKLGYMLGHDGNQYRFIKRYHYWELVEESQGEEQE